MKRFIMLVALLLVAGAAQAAVLTFDPEPDPYYQHYSDPATTWSWNFGSQYTSIESAVLTLYFKDGDF